MERFVWEWEDGDGFTAWGTHDPVLARRWLRWYYEDVVVIHTGDMSEFLPTMIDMTKGAKRAWINTKAHRDGSEDDADWKAHKHWAPWRTPALIYSF